MTIDLTGVSPASSVTSPGSAGRAASGSETSADAAPVSGVVGTASRTRDVAAAEAVATPAPVGAKLQFSMDAQTSQLVIQLVEGDSTQLIRKIPEEDVAQFAQTLDSATGNLVQSEA